jgi:hypothetical protein
LFCPRSRHVILTERGFANAMLSLIPLNKTSRAFSFVDDNIVEEPLRLQTNQSLRMSRSNLSISWGDPEFNEKDGEDEQGWNQRNSSSTSLSIGQLSIGQE